MAQTWSPLEAAVLRTLLYADIFSGTLTLNELHQYLISNQKFTRSDVRSTVRRLRDTDTTSELIATVYRGDVPRHFPTEKWVAIVDMVSSLAWIPWIESIWITGSVAVGNVQVNDDLDILFITSPRRLWLTRAVVVVFGILRGKYRRSHFSDDMVANQWCCNIWLEHEAAQVDQNRHDIYTAREVIQALPVYERESGLAARWLDKNRWVQEFCANGFVLARQRARTLPALGQRHPLFPGQAVLETLLNTLAYHVQMISIRAKQTREEVSLQTAFFHPSNTQQAVLEKYEKMCRHYSL
ncbi:hypothetical protein LRY58_04405 [Candidatus Woesebacteria bacterium]|nr:hypothetical protein [Candidatus Woesebacteria bacterium]MCD8545741.1 hypothetical protein [Candidatus Woesebacteria bacterium]